MKLIPDNASVTTTGNSTFFGYEVSFANGTNSYYWVGTCPSPVHGLLYDAVSNVTQDPRFVSAEGGDRYVVDPVNSLNGPVGNGNGSVYGELIFNYLNQSDSIYPCNLNYVYKNPIAAIYVLIPVTPNGTLVYDNDTINSFPGNQLNFNCPPEGGPSTFASTQIPSDFQVGNFSFNLISKGMNYVAPNGTSYPGYDYAFNVTYPSQNLSQVVVFSWPSSAALSANQEPSPFIAAPYGGYAVMRWFTNSTGLYLIVTARA